MFWMPTTEQYSEAELPPRRRQRAMKAPCVVSSYPEERGWTRRSQSAPLPGWLGGLVGILTSSPASLHRSRYFILLMRFKQFTFLQHSINICVLEPFERFSSGHRAWLWCSSHQVKSNDRTREQELANMNILPPVL